MEQLSSEIMGELTNFILGLKSFLTPIASSGVIGVSIVEIRKGIDKYQDYRIEKLRNRYVDTKNPPRKKKNKKRRSN